MSTTYTFLRGEPISLALEVTTGSAAGYTLTADLKRTTQNVVPGTNKAATATFTVTYEAASGATPARWLLTIPAATTATLGPGWYAADAVVRSGGSIVLRTTAVFVNVQDGVTA